MKNEWELIDDGRAVVWLNAPERLGGKIRLFATVDENMLDSVDAVPGTWNGFFNPHTSKWYVRTEVYGDAARKEGKQRLRLFMHRHLLGLRDESHIYVDHICIPDTMNNTLSNIRKATNSENSQNKHTKSKYGRGVAKCTQGSRYQARVRYNGVVYHIGTYDTARDAQVAVDAFNRIFNPFAITQDAPVDAIWIPDSRSIFPIVPDHIYEKAGVLHLKQQ